MDKDKKLDEILAEISDDIEVQWKKGGAVNDRTLLRWLFIWCPLIGAAAGYFSASVTAGVLIWGFLSLLQVLIQIRLYACDTVVHVIWLVSYFQKRAARHLD